MGTSGDPPCRTAIVEDWRGVLRWVGRRGAVWSPWLLLAALAAVLGPLILSRVAESVAPLNIERELMLSALALSYGAVLVGSAGAGRRRAGPWTGALTAAALAVALALHCLLHDDPWSTSASQWWLLPMLVGGASAVDRGAAGGVVMAAVGLWLWPLLSDQYFSMYYACASPPSPAEGAACGAVDEFARHAVAAGLGGLIAGAGTVRFWGERRVAAPLGALAVWLGCRAGIEACATHAAELACASSTRVASLESLASVARALSIVSSVSLVAAVVVGAWVVARGLRGETPGGAWRSSWALIPMVALASSPVFEPQLITSSMQQLPEAVWDQVAGVEPLTRPTIPGQPMLVFARSTSSVVATLDSEGGVEVFHAGGRTPLDRGVLAAPMDEFDGEVVPLVVDQYATMGDLREAARVLRRAGAIAVQWRANELHRATAAREEWAVVEAASRSLRSRRVHLVEVGDRCGGPIIARGTARAYRPCQVAVDPWDSDTERELVEVADDVPIGRWLREGGGWRRYVLAVDGELAPGEREVHARSGHRPWDEIFRRWLGPSAGWAALFATLLMLSGAPLAYRAGKRRRLARTCWLLARCVGTWLAVVVPATALGWWLMLR
jgi:hypothetical protein